MEEINKLFNDKEQAIVNILYWEIEGELIEYEQSEWRTDRRNYLYGLGRQLMEAIPFPSY